MEQTQIKDNGGNGAKTGPLAFGGRTKVDRYGWKEATEPGVMKWLPKQVIEIDAAYQREINDAKVVKMAAAFSWPAFGVVVVADRGDGRFFAIDGQHRLATTLRRADITVVPCIVFPMSSLADEARAFLAANTMRKAPSGIDRFKPSTLVGDEASLLVQELTNITGRLIVANATSSSGRVVRCLARMVTIARIHPDTLRKVYPLIDRVVGDAPLSERVLEGLVWVELHMIEGASLTDKRWADIIMARGGADLDRGAKQAAVSFAKGGASIWGQGVLAVVNRGLQKKLVLAP